MPRVGGRIIAGRSVLVVVKGLATVMRNGCFMMLSGSAMKASAKALGCAKDQRGKPGEQSCACSQARREIQFSMLRKHVCSMPSVGRNLHTGGRNVKWVGLARATC